MLRKKIAIYSSLLDNISIDKINKIKINISKLSTIEDIIVVTQDLLGQRPQHSALFCDFYLTFYDGDIIFLNKEDLMDKYNHLNNNSRTLFILQDASESDSDLPDDVQLLSI